jgi:TRAP-type C4-dicarboxylate transport system permease small subunit
MTQRWEKWDGVIGRLEQALVTVLLSVMILVPLLQIFLRNAFATGISWGDPLVRNLVLWVGFVGAAMATREGKHISIDLLSRFMSGRWSTLIPAVHHLASFAICALLTLASVKFIRNEAQAGSVTSLGIPAWVPEIIIPLTFALMGLRFGLRLCGELSMLPGSVPEGDRPGEP